MRSFLKCLSFACGGQIILLCNVFSFYYNNGILITMPISLFYLPILTLTPTSDFSFRSASFRSPFRFFLKNGTKRFYRFEQERNGTMKFAGAIKQAVSFQNHKKIVEKPPPQLAESQLAESQLAENKLAEFTTRGNHNWRNSQLAENLALPLFRS